MSCCKSRCGSSTEELPHLAGTQESQLITGHRGVWQSTSKTKGIATALARFKLARVVKAEDAKLANSANSSMA